MNMIKETFLKYKEMISYLFFGSLSTIVNFITYLIFTKVFQCDEVLGSGIAWLCAVLFAYVTNKIFVFKSKKSTFIENAKEAISFLGARVVSGILCDIGTFAVMIKILNINDIIAKIVTQIMVIIVNYIFSKFIIFKNPNKGARKVEE